MGFFSKKSIVQTTSQTDNYNTDARQAADGGSIVVRNGAVSIIDGGAIDAAQATALGAFDLAEGVADLGADFVFDALGFVQSNTRDAFDLVEASQNTAAERVQQTQDASNALVSRTIEQQREESAQLGSQILRLGIPAIAILGLIFIMKGDG